MRRNLRSIVQPGGVTVVGLEAQKFLQHGQAEHFGIGYGWGWSRPLNQLPGDFCVAGIFERIVQGAVGGDDHIFERQTGSGGHGRLL